jgi:uncharacterized protein YndB with AHSA1/START domain
MPFARPVTFCATGHVAAPIDQVFEVLTDPARMPEWLPGCNRAVAAGMVRQGARIEARFPGSRVTVFEVVDYAPPYRFGWVERGQRNGWRLWFRLNATGSATAATICEVWAPTSLAAWLWGKLIRRRHAERHVGVILGKLRSIVAS